MENYQCSQAVIGQLSIVSYRWLANSIMSTIIEVKFNLIVHSFVLRAQSRSSFNFFGATKSTATFS